MLDEIAPDSGRGAKNGAGDVWAGLRVNGQHFVISNEHTKKHVIENIEKLYEKHGYLKITYSTNRQRSLTQNAALHKFCELLADALNDAGLDMKKVMKPEVDIPWTPATVKDNLWRPVQIVTIGKESTAEAERDEYSKVYEILNRHLGQKFGVHIPWPVKDKMPISEAS